MDFRPAANGTGNKSTPAQYNGEGSMKAPRNKLGDMLVEMINYGI